MQMAGMDVLTAIKERLPIVYAVFNDARYNMVFHGMKQIFGESEPYDTPLIDFESWARSLGLPAATVRSPGQIPSLLRKFQRTRKPALLDIRIDREVRIRGGGRVEALQHMSMQAIAAAGGSR
jgi:acetolactate synthase-1/2/3 large subunit